MSNPQPLYILTLFYASHCINKRSKLLTLLHISNPHCLTLNFKHQQGGGTAKWSYTCSSKQLHRRGSAGRRSPVAAPTGATTKAVAYSSSFPLPLYHTSQMGEGEEAQPVLEGGEEAREVRPTTWRRQRGGFRPDTAAAAAPCARGRLGKEERKGESEKKMGRAGLNRNAWSRQPAWRDNPVAPVD